MATKKETKETEPITEPTIEIDRIAAETIAVPIIGTAPLIVHRFSEKARREMLETQQGRKKTKQIRDPEADYEASLYHLKGDSGYGFPATGFKKATIGAVRYYHDLTMTGLQQMLFFRGEIGTDGIALVRIEGEPVMREDVVRLGGRSADLRYRPMFSDWSAVLQVTFVKSAITRASVLLLIDAGGMGIGVGEWRVEKKGDFGTYQIDPTREVEVL